MRGGCVDLAITQCFRTDLADPDLESSARTKGSPENGLVDLYRVDAWLDD